MALRDMPSRLRAALAMDSALRVHLEHAANEILTGVKKDARENSARQPEVYTAARTEARVVAVNNGFKLDRTKRWATNSPGFKLLVKAIVDSDTVKPSLTLPGVGRPILPPTTLGVLLRKRGAPRLTPLGNPSTSSVSAPMFAGSSFNSIASTLVTIVDEQLDMVKPSDSDRDRWFGEICTAVCLQLNIHFIPWSPDTQGSNTPRKPAVWNQYIIIGQALSPSTASQSSIASQPPPSSVGVSQTVPAAILFGQPWSPGSMSLLFLPTHLSISRVPDDIDVGFEELSSIARLPGGIMVQGYDWVRASYSRKEKVHHLAVITAWFLSRLAPGYQLQKPPADAEPGTMPLFTFDCISRRHPTSDGPAAFGLWLMYLMNMLCEDSPVRQRMIQKKKKNVGEDWVDPMSVWSSF